MEEGRNEGWMDRSMGGLVDEWMVDRTTGLKVGWWKDGWVVGVTQVGLGV